MILPIAGLNRFGRTLSEPADREISYVDMEAHALRAARAMLDWSSTKLATMADVSLSTVRRLEDADRRGSVRRDSTAKIIETLARQRLTFHASADGVIHGVSRAALEGASSNPWKISPALKHVQ